MVKTYITAASCCKASPGPPCGYFSFLAPSKKLRNDNDLLYIIINFIHRLRDQIMYNMFSELN